MPTPPKTVHDLVDVGVLVAIAIMAVAISQKLDPASAAGGAAAMLGILLALGWAFLATRMHAQGFESLGLGRPASWQRTVVLAGLGTVVLFGIGLLIQSLLLPVLLEQETADTSRFNSIEGNLGALIQTLVVVWITAAFAEEVVYRGFLLPRLERLFGGGRWAMVAAIVAGAVGFGFLHLYQGVAGVIVTGWTGIALGTLYVMNGRNIWAAVLAHGLTHLISFTMLYAGMVPG